jgi:hypothetical protein
VPDALVIREALLNVSALLEVLPALTFLTIAFRLEQGYDNSTPAHHRRSVSAPAFLTFTLPAVPPSP